MICSMSRPASLTGKQPTATPLSSSRVVLAFYAARMAEQPGKLWA